MDPIQAILDKRIPIKLLQVSEGENVIFCKQFKAELFDSGFFSTKEKDFVHNYINENNQKYIVTDVTTPDDKIYKNVKFRVVVNEKGDVPYCTFNPKGTLIEKGEYKLPEKTKLITEQNIQKKETENKQTVVLRETPDYQKQEQECFEKAKKLQDRLIQEQYNLENERKELEKQKLVVENEKVISEKLNDYKQVILQEFFNVSEKQEKTIKEKLTDSYKLLEEKIYEQNKIQNEQAKKTLDLLNEKGLDRLRKELDSKIDEKQKEIEKLVEDKAENSARLLVEKADDLRKLFEDKFVVDLEEHKKDLFEKFGKLSKQVIENFVDEKAEEIVDELTKQLIEAKKEVEKQDKQEKQQEEAEEKSQLQTDVKNLVNKEIANYQKDLAEQLNDLRASIEQEIAVTAAGAGEGGGGNNSFDYYPNGGPMNGNLSFPVSGTGIVFANGQLLSSYPTGGGGGGGGGDPAVNALVYSNSANWDLAYTNLIYNSASYLTGASLDYVNTTFVKISGDTMTGTLSVAPAAYVLSPSFATFVKNNDYPSLSATLRQNYDFYNSEATFAVPGGIIIKGQSPSYDTSIRNLPGLGVYGLWLENVNNMDPGTTFVSDGRAAVTHAMSFRAGIANFTAGSDHNHVLWQGAPSNPTQSWQMSNGGNNTNGPQGYLTNRFFLHTLPQYQISTAITTQNNGLVDTRNALLLTGTDRLTGVKVEINLPPGTNNYHLVSPGVVIGLQINPGVAGLVAATYQSQCTSVSANATLSTFQFDVFLGNTSNWVPAQAALQTVNLSARSLGGNPGINLITSQIGVPATHYVGLTGNYLNLPKHCLARFTTNDVLTGLKTGSPLTIWIPQNMPSNAPGGTGFVTSETNTGPTGSFRYGYFDAFVRTVSGTDLEFVIGNLMDTYAFQNRTWSLTAAGTAGWVIYGGSQDTVHRPTFGTTGFYFEREPWLFTSSDNFSFLSGGMVKNVVLGTSESYGLQSYGMGFRGVVMGNRSGVLAGEANVVYSDYSVALGGFGLISLSSTPYQAVIGKYNNPNNNALMVVGNGLSDTNRSNIIEVSNSSVSVSGVVYVSGGNSNQWNSNYTTTNSNSANWSSTYQLQTSNFNATKGSLYLVNTLTLPITCTLPASPQLGDTIYFMDPFLSWNNNNFILNNNGNMIESISDSLTCDLKGLKFFVTYVGSSVGWRVG